MESNKIRTDGCFEHPNSLKFLLSGYIKDVEKISQFATNINAATTDENNKNFAPKLKVLPFEFFVPLFCN